jgi:hypothetical protein
MPTLFHDFERNASALALIDESLPLGGTFSIMQPTHLHLVTRTVGIEFFLGENVAYTEHINIFRLDTRRSFRAVSLLMLCTYALNGGPWFL